jgi:hypothetical protein
MRRLIYFSILLLISCNNKNVGSYLLADYQYPLDSLIVPKVFVYQRNDSVDKFSFRYQQLIIKNKQKILICVLLGDEDLRDSSVYYVINNKPILNESYYIMKDFKTNIIKSTKGQIIENIDNGLIIKSKIKYTDPIYESLTITFNTISKYDTIAFYKFFDKELKCIKYKSDITISSNPIIDTTIEKSGVTIFAKGLGVVYHSVTNKKTKVTNSWKLKEIIDYKKYKKK